MWAQIVNTLLGVWLIAAPGVLEYRGRAATNDWIVGPLAATFALIAVWEVTRPVRWLNVPIGIWLIVAPFSLHYGYELIVPALNSVVVGGLLMFLAAVRPGVRRPYGGGWRAAW